MDHYDCLRPSLWHALDEVPVLSFSRSAASRCVGLSSRLSLQIFSAVRALHSEGVAHLDIKPANVTVTRPFRPSMVRRLDFSRERRQPGREREEGKGRSRDGEEAVNASHEERNRTKKRPRHCHHNISSRGRLEATCHGGGLEKESKKKNDNGRKEINEGEKEGKEVPVSLSEKKRKAEEEESLRCLLVDLDSAQFYQGNRNTRPEKKSMEKKKEDGDDDAAVYPGGEDKRWRLSNVHTPRQTSSPSFVDLLSFSCVSAWTKIESSFDAFLFSLSWPRYLWKKAPKNDVGSFSDIVI